MIVDQRSIESRRIAVQAQIDAEKSARERNRLGQFATPQALALDMARYVDAVRGPSEGGIRFADPAIGSGSFYSAALSVFGPKRIDSAVGVEIDAAFAAAARSLWAGCALELVLGDFTQVIASAARPVAPNLVLANPPYVRHHHISREDKERLRALVLSKTGVDVSGLAGLYVYFLLLTTAWMEADGVAAWLIPSEFMDVNYGAALKGFLANQVTLVRVHRFDPEDAQFGDAIVSSAVLVLRKTAPPLDHAVEFTYGGSLAQPQVRDHIALHTLRLARKWTSYPRHEKSDRHTLSDGVGPVLGDLFRVQRGIATGCNKFFVLERAQAQQLGLPGKHLRPILPSPRHLKSTRIDADGDGYPLLAHQLCVIDCNLPEDMVKAKHPALWEYLQTAQALGVMEGHLVGKRSPWYRQEQREPTPFLCTYMGRGASDKAPFRFIWNRSQAIGTNLYLMLYPRDHLQAMLAQHPERAQQVHALLGQVTGDELRGEGRVYGGGLNKIEPRELARISATPFVALWPDLGRDALPQGTLFA